jgi:hypothetical protein
MKKLLAKVLHGIAICLAAICFWIAMGCDWLTSIAYKLED